MMSFCSQKVKVYLTVLLRSLRLNLCYLLLIQMIFFCAFFSDKTISFGFIEEFYCAFIHYKKLNY